MFVVLKMSKSEIEHFLDLHAKANGIVSYDIAEYIMQNDNIREEIRSARDKQGASPNWDDFIKNFIKWYVTGNPVIYFAVGLTSESTKEVKIW